MADNIQVCINQIHDLSLEKTHVINDKNFRRYLPKKHKFLRSVYQAWICLFILSLLLVFAYFYFTDMWIRALAYNGLLAILIYSVFILLLSLGLYAGSYTVPIAVTNEVKAKIILRINKRLDVLKESLQRLFTKAVIADGLHKGKFGLNDIKKSVNDFIQTGFPNVQYIKEIVTDEIIKLVEKEVADYVAEMSNALKAKLKDSAVKIQRVAEKEGTSPEFIVIMIKWMLDKGTIDGALIEFDTEYVPSGAASTATTQAAQPAIPAPAMQQSQAGIAVDAPIILDQQGKPTTIIVQSPGSSALPSIDAVKIRLEDKKNEIEAAKVAFERGDLGFDAYVSKSGILESQLAFLKHRLLLLEKVQDPKKYCMVCFQSVAGGGTLVKCPNDHAFHLDHAQEWLSKHEHCPWCEQKITAFPSS
ncbi:MAG: hypothetical protein JW839_18025 [Candidatus Lokiarchaeota archaeon]|nr:hypothetical protein [Candidatus Lokiarchaeota archaeon]